MNQGSQQFNAPQAQGQNPGPGSVPGGSNPGRFQPGGLNQAGRNDQESKFGPLKPLEQAAPPSVQEALGLGTPQPGMGMG